MVDNNFYGEPLIRIPDLQQLVSQHEELPVEVRLLDARVYPDGYVRLVRHSRRSRSSMSIRHLEEKYGRAYPGLDFTVGVHGRTRLDTARRNLGQGR